MIGEPTELGEQVKATDMWRSAEEEGLRRTLTQGMELLLERIEQARAGAPTVSAADVFFLHDTHGFPYETTSELLAEEGLESRATSRC